MLFCIHTFGCQMNENDSRLMAGLLISAGHIQVDNLEEADIAIINTCCVRESAENRAFGYIGSLKKWKQENPHRIVVVCGCMIQKDGNSELLRKSYRHVGIVIGTFATALLPRYIESYAATGERIIDVEERYDLPKLCRGEELPVTVENGYRAQININYGCNNFCTYCIVPYVRGRERSRKPQEILAEIEQLAAIGVKEIQLLGQNVNSYGKDLADGSNFASLLTSVNDIEGITRIRYMTSHPRDFSRDLIETIAGLDKVCHHFHLPLQSGCNRILQQMNRAYCTEEYGEHLRNIRAFFPDATITTDIIVGFPGETEQDFVETLHYMQEARFDAAYTFLYSRRSGTPAAQMAEQVDESVKRQRLQRLMDVQNEISRSINERLVESCMPVMLDGASKNNPNMLSGRTDGNKIVVFPAPKTAWQAGQIFPVQITEAQTWNLKGEIEE